MDLYRPKFDEETARGDMMMNTRILWQTLWQKEVDVRAAIIRTRWNAAGTMKAIRR